MKKENLYQIPESFRGEDYYSHIPVLKHIIENEITNLDDGITHEYVGKKFGCIHEFIEMGVGHGSSGIMRHACLNYNARVISFETDKEWWDKITDEYSADTYDQIFVKNWDRLYNMIGRIHSPSPDLVFIDQAPWEARIQAAHYFADMARFIIIHDYDFYPREMPELHEKLKAKMKYWKLYEDVAPPTLVCSNFNEVDFDIDFSAIT